ncbi:MAG TPA: response regulator transcription factor [Ignavibacteriaceae bacterium]|jgi:DNA-binding NarL/FixJ family response regulator|nr:response regulator transcription factor [Ignavibacteriaceae bacterium]
MQKLNIFIVDDASSIRRSLRGMLSKLNNINIFGEADSVESAKIFLHKNKPDLTLLDLNLPDGSGYDVLSYIKNGEHNHTVIVLTNYSAEQYKIKAIESGADYFFDKSTEFEKIIKVINSLITSY